MHNRHPNKSKILVIVGPTSSGKSDLAVKIAKKFDGEIISADSRQVYRRLNIGTGKITKKEMEGVPHHLIDIADPKKMYTAADFKDCGEKAIKDIISRGKIPIIAGGTGFYVQTLIDNVVLPPVPPNKELRRRLENKSVEQILSILSKLDPDRAQNIDQKNKRRLIRAIEIAETLGKVPKQKSRKSEYKILQIGIKTDDKKLKEKITTRLLARLPVRQAGLPAGEAGISRDMVAEAEKLHEKGLSWKRMEELGLEYRYLAKYLKGEMSKTEMITKLESEIWKYAKRQKTWFKKDKRINWFLLSETKKIESAISKFLTQ